MPCLVETFAAHGARVAFIDKDKESGRKLAERLGDKTTFISGDIAEESTIFNFARHVIRHCGSIHCLINNACLSRRGILSDCGFEDFSYVLRVGVAAPYMLAKLFLDNFAPGASIINIASTRAFMSQADTESYCLAPASFSCPAKDETWPGMNSPLGDRSKGAGEARQAAECLSHGFKLL